MLKIYEVYYAEIRTLTLGLKIWMTCFSYTVTRSNSTFSDVTVRSSMRKGIRNAFISIIPGLSDPYSNVLEPSREKMISGFLPFSLPGDY